MATFAAAGNRVLFVENTGVRAVSIGDLPRLRSRLRNWWRGTKGFREERPNLFVFSPVVVPLPYSRLARWINRTVMSRALKRWIRAMEFHRVVAWTFLPTPLVRDLLREIEPRLTIYYCIDDFGSSSSGARKITRSENQVLQEADLVFVTSEKLRERAARFNDHVHLFPFGVNYEAFERVRLGSDHVPPELDALPRPIVGYVGGLHQWLDQALVCAVADAMPAASVALIGPPQTDVSRLEGRQNIHVLGSRPHDQLPHYVKAFDVGIVPYRSSDYTAHVYPTKLNEYLAMGIPVVATDLLEIRHFNDRHGHVVATAPADDPGAFVAAVRHLAQDSAPQQAQQRAEVARRNSWSSRIAEMSTLIGATLTERENANSGWETALRRAYRRARRRTVPAVAAALATYVLLFHTSAVWIAAAPLRIAATPEPANAIVVFGGGVGESGEAGGSYQERVRTAVDLYHGGYANAVVFSSGFVYAFKEAEVMRALAVTQGVPASNIILETASASTNEYVRAVRKILEQHGWTRILLVSSPYHMRRALMTWNKLAPEVTVVPTPPATSQFYNHGVGASLRQIKGIAHEYVAMAYYRVKGWL
jgi:uncharacterized SAM-binding protein YcdF (DUF218 family)/glycosyltransferase involved in cell wall biosynthesis